MTAAATLHALLTGAIDYAGLFPPASLSMHDAVERYANYRQSGDAWALGRFVLPLTRTSELTAAQEELRARGQGWRLTVLINRDGGVDGAAIREFNQSNAGSALIDSAEAKVGGAPSAARHEIAAIAARLSQSLRLFVEVPATEEVGAYIAAVGAANACAKIRTGGVTADAFPAAKDVARFLVCCAEQDIAFKATAGLHHPCRGRYPLTYDADAPVATMFGFLNVLIAATVARVGGTIDEVTHVLETGAGADFRFEDNEIVWRDVRVSRQQVLESHATFALSFGSCSFEEPMHDLRGLGLL